MFIEFDSTKRQKTLEERGIDFCDAPNVFKGIHFTAPDGRMDYGEPLARTSCCGGLDNQRRCTQNYFYEVHK